MRLENVDALKQEVRVEYYSDFIDATASPEGPNGYEATAEAINESIRSLRPEQRISFGISNQGSARKSDQYRLEIRIQREGGIAHRAALKYVERASGEAAIEIVPRIEVPPLTLMKSLIRRRGQKRISAKRHDPLTIGVSVSHRDGPAGTCGAFVEVGHQDAVLSNCHVLALSGRVRTDEDNPVFHPAVGDVVRRNNRMRIGELRFFSEFSKGTATDVDAAVATLFPHVQHQGNQIPSWSGHPRAGSILRTPINPMSLAGPVRVQKIGRTSGLTTGSLSAIALDDVPVDVPGLGVVFFNDVIEIRSMSDDEPFSEPGDSGSVLFTEDGLEPFGIHFAGEYRKTPKGRVKLSYSCVLESALDAVEAGWIT